MAELSKLQIRAKLLAVISEIKSSSDYNQKLLLKFVEELNVIEDKTALFDMFIKEYIKLNENECMFCACLINALINKELITEKSFEILQSANYSDEAKYKIVQLLRVVDAKSTNDIIPQYFENPEDVIDMETRKLLDTASVNPESMLDFLDFLYTIPFNDKEILLNSLKDDYQGDALANIVYPILYSDFEDNIKLIAVDILSDSKSSVAIAPIKYLSEISNNEKIIQACTLALKKLRLAGADEVKAGEYFKNIVKNIKPAEFYSTIPDGSGNQALLSSRVSDDNKYTFSAVVINDMSGIVDNFGFYNIPKEEFIKITAKFFNSEGKYSVSAKYVKSRINEAFELSKKLKHPMPYEFICWNVLINDLEGLEKPLSECITPLNTDDVKKDDVLNVLTKEYTYRWFLTASNSTKLKQFTENIYNLEVYDIKKINEMLIQTQQNVFDKDYDLIWKERLINLIYILDCNSKKDDASKFLYILKNDEMFNLFKSILLERSVFNHFFMLKDNLKDRKLTVNIFRKKKQEENQYSENKLNEILKILESNWMNG